MHADDRRAALAITAALAVASASAFAMIATTSDDIRYVYPDDIAADLASRAGSELRVHGWVVPGTIRRTANRLTFDLERHGASVHVVAIDPGPDFVCDGRELIVRARVPDAPPYELDAIDMLARCPDKYEGDARPTCRSLSPEAFGRDQPGDRFR